MGYILLVHLGLKHSHYQFGFCRNIKETFKQLEGYAALFDY